MSRHFIPLLAALALTTLAACGDDEPDTPAPDPEETPGQPTSYPCSAACRVIDYHPAPGQFVNVLPAAPASMAYYDMVDAASASLARGSMVTLGAFGGSITIRLDEPIYNVAGEPDLQVLGNAFDGSAEPGIVQVMADTNGNGQPDDGHWLLLPGDHLLDAPLTCITYYPPATDATDAEYIRWECTDVTTGAVTDTGWLRRIPAYHMQSYMPDWDTTQAADDGSYSYTFWRLPSNVTYDPTLDYYTLASYAGYADSYANADPRSYLSLDTAYLIYEDSEGHHCSTVTAERVDFIRITTGVLGSNGMLGEISTEVGGICRLHP